MTHAKESSRGTVAELRALLERATPGPWGTYAWEEGEPKRVVHAPPMPSGQLHVVAEATDYEGSPAWTRSGEDNAALIAALRNAAPDLLRVVEAVANIEAPTYSYSVNPAETEYACHFCDEDMPGAHDPDCAWVLARKLTGRVA